MALNFPSSPTIGQVYTDTISGFSYEWDGTVWRSFSPSSSSQIKALDDISGSFDGIETTFPLTSNASQITSPSPQSLIINLGGVIQDPTGDYTVLGSNLIFSTPPTSGLSFSGVSLGPAVPINTITDGTVTDGSLRISTNAVVGSATTFTEDLVVEGDARVTGILTVGTSSLTLNGNTNTINGVTISSGIVTATDVTVGLTTITGSTGNIITPGSVTTGNLQSSSINGGPLAGMRNAIINGNFDIWQRGTSFTNPAHTAYTADLWQVVWNGSGATRTAERVAFPIGQTDVPGEPAYMFRLAQTVAGTGATFNSLVHHIEDVRVFAGQQVTVSFYIRATAAINLPALQFVQVFGTGGSPSAPVFTVLLTNVSITTNWQKIQATVTVPSISGKTLGSDGNSNLVLDIVLPINTTFSFDIAQVQVEPGPVATTFERRPIGTELALCQRYFELTTVALVTTVVSIAQAYSWKAEKRAIPTLVLTPAGGTGGVMTPYFTSSAYQSNDHTNWAQATLTASAEL